MLQVSLAERGKKSPPVCDTYLATIYKMPYDFILKNVLEGFFSAATMQIKQGNAYYLVKLPPGDASTSHSLYYSDTVMATLKYMHVAHTWESA